MLTWQEIVTRSEQGNVAPRQRVEKSDQQWQSQLSDEQYRVTRQKGTNVLLARACVPCLNQAYTAAFVAAHCCLMRMRSLTLVPAGLHSHNRPKIAPSHTIKIPVTG